MRSLKTTLARPLVSNRTIDLRARADPAASQVHLRPRRSRLAVVDSPLELSNTWSCKGDLACWRIGMPRIPSNIPRDALIGCVVSVVRALEGFARPTEASWTSAATGEDALEQELGDPPLATLLASTLVDPTEVVLCLTLDVDLYAWRILGRYQDNHATGALNAPRLRCFLERRQRDLGARIEDIDAPDCPGQVDGLGFHPPE